MSFMTQRMKQVGSQVELIGLIAEQISRFYFDHDGRFPAFQIRRLRDFCDKCLDETRNVKRKGTKGFIRRKLYASSWFLYQLWDDGSAIPYGGAYKSSRNAVLDAKNNVASSNDKRMLGFIICKRSDCEDLRILKGGAK